jgi:putative membrane protein
VVIHPQSGSYRDVNLLFAALVAWLSLLYFIFSDTNFNPYGIAIELAVIFAAAAGLCSITPLPRLLTARKRRLRQVQDAAAVAFFNEEVANTRARSGVLVYLSLLEREAELIADIGVKAIIPAVELAGITAQLAQVGKSPDMAAALLEKLSMMGVAFAKFLPANAEDNPDELPNRPRTRL